MARPQRIQVFQGTTPKPTRDYLQVTLARLRTRYRRIVVPCAGRFTIPQLARGAGFLPEQIISSDISLYSSVMGYHVAGLPIADLGVEFGPELADLERYRDDDRFAAAVMYGMKWAQFAAGSSYYMQQHAAELRRHEEHYVDRFHKALNAMAQQLGPIDYGIRDVFDEMTEYEHDPETILYINPPAYKAGYTKMFDFGEHVTWNVPKIAEFDPTTGLAELFDYARRAECLTIWYRYKDVDEEEAKYVTFLHEYRADRHDRTLVGRPDEVLDAAFLGKPYEIHNAGHRVLPYDFTIRPDSLIQIRSVPTEVAMYYRDLFAHKLGTTRAESYYGLFLDGYLFGVVGMMTGHALRRQHGQQGLLVHETFGFTCGCQYDRINKLLMLCITTTQFVRELIKAMPPLAFVGTFRFQTTCLADVPEVKANRGVLKLAARKKLKNGKFHLNYYTDFRAETYADCLTRWLKKDGKVLIQRKPQEHLDGAAA